MRRLRWLAIAVLIVCAIGAVLFAFPASRYLVLAMVRGESFHENRPVGFWAYQLKSDNAEVRLEAVRALGQMGPGSRRAVPDLAAALKDPNDTVRLNAALALYKVGPEAVEALDELIDALKDPHPQVRMNSALALTQLGPACAPFIPSMLDAYQNDENGSHVAPFHHSVRQQLGRALGRIGPPAKSAVPVLTASLSDGDAGVRATAAFALGRIGPDAASAIPSLELCLNDDEQVVRDSAKTALTLLKTTPAAN